MIRLLPALKDSLPYRRCVGYLAFTEGFERSHDDPCRRDRGLPRTCIAAERKSSARPSPLFPTRRWGEGGGIGT
jgi:hypothetical protein